MKNNPTFTNESAILVGVVTPGTSRWDVEDALNELSLLASTAGAQITDRVTQTLPSINAATYIGKGKVRELKELVGMRQSDLVIFDDDLSAIQMRNLEREIGCKLIDRSGLILDIFARNAKTAVAKTQVELAQLDYMMTRLTRQWTHLSRQKGGIGTKGPGETQIETDRRMIGSRMALLKERLEKIDRQRSTQRKGRERMTRVSLVGYTNAGKSTLMNALSDSTVKAENRLFATLDTTTRTVDIEKHGSVLLSDTVGFIRKLPHKLIESFKSTLDEVRESDILLHVVDVGHPCYEDQVRVVNETLVELGANAKPTIIVFNKVDMLMERAVLHSLKQEFTDAVFVSALRGIGLEALRDAIRRVVESGSVERTVYLPVSEAGTIAYIHRIGRVLSEHYMTIAGGNGEKTGERDVVKLTFSTPRRYESDIAPLAKRYRDLQQAASRGDGASVHAERVFVRPGTH